MSWEFKVDGRIPVRGTTTAAINRELDFYVFSEVERSRVQAYCIGEASDSVAKTRVEIPPLTTTTTP